MVIISTKSDKPKIVLGPLLILNRRNHKTNYFMNPDGSVSAIDNAEEQRQSNAEYIR